jgi:hypothetical protein
MSTQVQFRRGSTAETATFTGASGEITVDTDKKTAVIQDGSTAGGFPLLRQDLNNIATGAITSAMIANGTITNDDINASAAIVDTKLDTISTAGKVSGSAITSGTIGGSTAINTSGSITTSSTVSDTIGNVRDIPQNSQTSSYQLVAGDVGKHISITTGGVTVPSSVFSVGDAVSVYNDSGSDQTITQGSGVTLRQAGTANTGNRTLAQYGIATMLCVGTDTFVISGAGLS